MPSEVRILPSPPAIYEWRRAGVAQLVEREPSKLGVAGSNPVSRSRSARCARDGRAGSFQSRRLGAAHVAQSVEHFLGKEEVMGSIPVMGFRKFELDGRWNDGRRVQ